MALPSQTLIASYITTCHITDLIATRNAIQTLRVKIWKYIFLPHRTLFQSLDYAVMQTRLNKFKFTQFYQILSE